MSTAAAVEMEEMTTEEMQEGLAAEAKASKDKKKEKKVLKNTKSMFIFDNDGGYHIISDPEDPNWCPIPTSPDAVRIDMDTLHYALFGYPQVDDKPREKGAPVPVAPERYVRITKNIVLVVRNPCVNFGGAITMAGIMKLMQMKSLYKKDEIEIISSSIGGSAIIATSIIELLHATGRGCGTKAVDSLIDDIERLKAINISIRVFADDIPADFNAFSEEDREAFYITKSGKRRTTKIFGFIDALVIPGVGGNKGSGKKGPGKNVKLQINGVFLDSCYTASDSLCLRHRELQGKPQAVQGLMMYLAGQRGSVNNKMEPHILLSDLQHYFGIFKPKAKLNPFMADGPDRRVYEREDAEATKAYQHKLKVFRRKIKEALELVLEKDMILGYRPFYDPTGKDMIGYAIKKKPMPEKEEEISEVMEEVK